ncbi:helix-turn-helix domain-containing protein [Bacteroidia bacterium]|nr:helix-turn-helix domain-containing protein [Bacteroidia bacterium]
MSQSILMEQCKDRVGAKNLAAELADLLGVNIDAAYRRIRGDTSLAFDEIQKVCLHFNISFDSVINYQGRLVPFQFNAMFRDKFSIISYLTAIEQELKMLSSMGTDDARITMTAMDLPYFRQFGFKSLSRFKLFFWQRSVLNLTEFSSKKFDANESLGEYEEITDRIYRSYHGVPSTEVWAPETLDSTIKQLQYYLDSGLFIGKESALLICDDIDALLTKLEREAQLGRKLIQTSEGAISSPFEMYQSDIFLSNNCIQAFKDGRVYTYVSFNSFNSLMSFSSHFSEECNRWIEQIRLKSILLSEVSEKLRYQFFKSLRQKLEGLRATI